MKKRLQYLGLAVKAGLFEWSDLTSDVNPVSEKLVADLMQFAELVEADKPARKPLTDERIDQIIASNVTITDRNLYGAVYMAIREVEAAHGIGGEA